MFRCAMNLENPQLDFPQTSLLCFGIVASTENSNAAFRFSGKKEVLCANKM